MSGTVCNLPMEKIIGDIMNTWLISKLDFYTMTRWNQTTPQNYTIVFAITFPKLQSKQWDSSEKSPANVRKLTWLFCITDQDFLQHPFHLWKNEIKIWINSREKKLHYIKFCWTQTIVGQGKAIFWRGQRSSQFLLIKKITN